MKRAIHVKAVSLLMLGTLLADPFPIAAQPVPGNLPVASVAPASVADTPPPSSLPAMPGTQPAVPMASTGDTTGAIWSEPDACQRSRFVGGLGIYLVQPYFANNPAVTVVRSIGDIQTQIDRTDLRHHMNVAPELWLGYVGESGFGARLRWWYFRQGTSVAFDAPPGTDDDNVFFESAAPLGLTAFTDNEGQAASVAVTSKLQLQVWDLEGTQTLRNGSWDLQLSGGLRLAHITQQYNAYVVGDSGGDDGGPISASLESGHSFHGVGPMVGLNARRPITDSGLAWFGIIRGALLFGSAKQNALDTFTGGADPAEITTAQDHRTRVLPVCELELGVEYKRNMDWVQAFGQLALVGQNWFGAGNASRSTQANAFGLPFGGSIVDNDLGFFGFAMRLGVDY
jgi:hypothetical protein